MRVQRSVVFGASLALGMSGLTTGCTDRPYTSPQEQAANACQALGPKALSGALIGGLAGAAGGALIGNAAGGGRGAGIGALIGGIGGVVGGLVVGKQLDQRDCAEAQAALQQVGSAPVGVAVSWSNPATGSHGDYTPVGASYAANGTVCRQIRADYYMKDHQPVTGDTGLVCRTPQGDWVRQTNAG